MLRGFFFSGFGETLQGFFFVVEFLEDAVELRDFQDFFDLRRESHHFHFAALLDHAHVAINESADAGTVEIQQAADVENDLLLALFHEVADGLA